jgi:hypothetical protein
MQRHRIQLI